jgi:hypothetical protein
MANVDFKQTNHTRGSGMRLLHPGLTDLEVRCAIEAFKTTFNGPKLPCAQRRFKRNVRQKFDNLHFHDFRRKCNIFGHFCAYLTCQITDSVLRKASICMTYTDRDSPLGALVRGMADLKPRQKGTWNQWNSSERRTRPTGLQR